MNILYIACSCSPYHGSEDKIGWNVPVESAKINRVSVITRESQRQYVEKYLSENPIENITFYYVDVPKYLYKLARKISFTVLLRVWNKKAVKLAKEICDREKIDIIHQITPVEFRSIGDYWKINNTKFVVGPVGGGEYIPKGLRSYANKYAMVEVIRYLANVSAAIRLSRSRFFEKCSYIMFANKETHDFLMKLNKSIPPNTGNTCRDMNVEIGIERKEYKEKDKKCVSNYCSFLVVGRQIYRKGGMLLLDALSRIPRNLEYECRVVGTGKSIKNMQAYCDADPFLKKKVIFEGYVHHKETEKAYCNADVFIMPSIRETTGTVLLEALINGTPVVTINRFGGALLLNTECAWLYDGNTKEEYIKNLKNILIECINNPEEVRRRGLNARKRAEDFTWEKRIEYYHRIYEKVLV